MARNKHPEETVNLILDVAFQRFMEKGYELKHVEFFRAIAKEI